MEPDTYLTVKAFSEGLYKEKGSRFISMAWPVTNQEEIKSILEKARKEHHSARHHCYAWMLGQNRENFRVNDDGEPSGSAGKPILGQINAFQVTNVLIVVVRYFGGKLLGISGLINAYRTAAEDAINNAQATEKMIMQSWSISFTYLSMNDVMKVLKEEGCDQQSHQYGNDCSIEISMRASSAERTLERLKKINNLTAKWVRTG